MAVFADKIFSNPMEILEARTKSEFEDAFSRLQKAAKNGKYCLGYIKYEAWKIFADCPHDSSEEPLLYFEVYDTFDKFSPQVYKKEISAVLIPQISREEYFSVFEKIANDLRNGETYEVNFAYAADLICSECEDFELFNILCMRQNAPYRAYISNRYETILSFSPELFFRLKDGLIKVKPMKGTSAKSGNAGIDARRAVELACDTKNRAENLMIVDLMRNDLSRISKTGSVKVEKMFEVEELSTVYQMTSTISAELVEGVDIAEIFRNIFPCGSVTGAPKLATLRIIESLEKIPRGVYCGAICLLAPEEIVCSVPIRILQKRGDSGFVFHSGSAVVWDSTAAGEWLETFDKMRFVNGDFKIIETVLIENSEAKFLKEHLERMSDSARVFGFVFNSGNILKELDISRDGIVRIELSRDGSASSVYRELCEAKTFAVVISKTRIDTRNVFLYHKTTKREWYSKAMSRIMSGEVYDEIFLNERGEVAEGARSNLVVEKDGVFYTPPKHSGLLCGVFRRIMLPKLVEKVLYKSDILNADKIYCINSVRGMVRVFLDGAASGTNY